MLMETEFKRLFAIEFTKVKRDFLKRHFAFNLLKLSIYLTIFFFSAL